MKVAEGQQQDDLMEIIEDRLEWKATIVASQLQGSKCYDVIDNEVNADAILDKIVYSSLPFDLKDKCLR